METKIADITQAMCSVVPRSATDEQRQRIWDTWLENVRLRSLLDRTLVAVEGWSYLLTSDMDCPLAREIKEVLQ